MNLPRAKHSCLRMPAVPDGSDPVPDVHRYHPPQAFSHIGVSAGILGVPVGAAWLTMPLFGVIVSAAEVAVVLVVVLTALYGSDRNSDRAFRLLRWSLNRSEPPAERPRRVRK
jgi:hypothetical protein